MSDLPYVIVRREITRKTGDAILGAMWPSGEVIFDDEFDGPEQQLSAGWQAMISASPSPVSLEEIVEVLKPFAHAWLLAETHKNMTLGQIGVLAAHEVSGVHFQRAKSLLDRLSNKGEE
jgi:hypothetical protein